jgi:RIO kinase 1
MLCAGVVHGDLSDFNVLLDENGPVIIDFPQAVNAASNQSARKLLLRDVDNLHRWLTRFMPEHKRLPYAEEMWQLYERGELTPDVKLTGRYRANENKVNTRDLLDLVADAEHDERQRRQRLGIGMRGNTNPRGDASARPVHPPRGDAHARGDASRRPPQQQQQPRRDERAPAHPARRPPVQVSYAREPHRRGPEPSARPPLPVGGRPTPPFERPRTDPVVGGGRSAPRPIPPDPRTARDAKHPAGFASSHRPTPVTPVPDKTGDVSSTETQLSKAQKRRRRRRRRVVNA